MRPEDFCRPALRTWLHNPVEIGTLEIVKGWHSIALAGLAVVAGYSVCAYRPEIERSGRQYFAAISGRFSSAPIAPIAWQAVDRSADGFKVDMPAGVKEIQVPAYNENGSADLVSMIYANPVAQTSFSVAWADNPPVLRANGGSTGRTLDMARDEELARTQTRLIGESKTTTDGFPSRDIVAQNSGGGIIHSRIVLAGSRLYMLNAAFPSAEGRREPDVRRFYDSFQAFAPATQEKPRAAEPSR